MSELPHVEGGQRLHLHRGARGLIPRHPAPASAPRTSWGRLAGIVVVAAALGLACAESDGRNVGAESSDPVDAVAATSGAVAPTGADVALSERQREALNSAALPSGMDLEMIERGAGVFLGRGNCHVCHAEDARGARGVGADLTDDEWWNSDGSWRGIVETIESGVPSEDSHNEWGAMMPVRGGSEIDDEDVRAVAAYVWSLRLVAPDSVS